MLPFYLKVFTLECSRVDNTAAFRAPGFHGNYAASMGLSMSLKPVTVMRVFQLSVLSGTLRPDIWELLGLSLEKPPQLEELQTVLGKIVPCCFILVELGVKALRTV